MDLGHWQLSDDITASDDFFGFIYEIINTITNKKYIGKKQCQSRLKRKPLRGKKRNRIDYVESDWREYTSSSNELNEDIVKYGKDKFIFKIIKICNSKWALAYYEIKEQIDRDVLMREDYYNGIINVRIGRVPKGELTSFKELLSLKNGTGNSANSV
jgi:hypothetical protein